MKAVKYIGILFLFLFIQIYAQTHELILNAMNALQSGQNKLSHRDDKGALKDFNKAIDLYSKSKGSFKFEGGYNGRGLAKSHLKDHRGALKDFNKELEINPGFAEVYKNRAVEKCALKDLKGALKDLDRVIEINPKNADSYNYRGIIKNKMGDRNEACIDWEKAVELGYSSAKNMIKKYCKK